MHFSLKYRIAAIIFILEAVMVGIILWQTLDHSQMTIRDQLASHDRAVLEIMGGISRIALLTEEYADFQPYLENLLKDTRIKQVLLLDSRDLVVAGSNPDIVGKPPPQIFSSSPPSAIADHTFWRSHFITNGAGRLGTIAIEISNDELRAAIAEARNLGISLAIGGMVLIAMVGLIAGSLLTRRLAVVTATANRFARGERTARTGIEGEDEIGELGKTFDQMATKLQVNQDEGDALIKQLSDKNAQLEQFTYTVSHDLKTPLVTVRGFAGMLEQDIANGKKDDIKKDLDYIMSGTATMANLLEDLLKLSQAGLTISDRVEVNLTDLFEKAKKELNYLIEERGVKIDIEKDMPTVYADKIRLLEVAHNLLHNAIKFSNPGHPAEISVSAEIKDASIICRVKDNGIGIRARYHEVIFGLFNRLDQSYEGTGIGLALVKTIIEAHDGTIDVESQGDNKGSLFRFILPAPDNAEAIPAASEQR